MPSPNTWTGYDPDFLDGFNVPIPDFGKWESDLAINNETGTPELPYIHYSSFQSSSRRLPVVTASNIFRTKWVQGPATSTFRADPRIGTHEQLSTAIYKAVNSNQPDVARKMAKGHMVRREDVQWTLSDNPEDALEASASTFFYPNASPQHQAVNNVIWKSLENSILIKGRSRDPQKVIVFTGPVLSSRDQWLVIPGDDENEIRCPMRFWKVIYYVTKDNELRYASFLMSHKEEVEEDGYVTTRLKLVEIFESIEKPFLDFDEKEKYQVNISLIEKLTDLKFPEATEALEKDSFRALSMEIQEGIKAFSEFHSEPLVEGLVL
jgi:endonuclease G